jgi:AmiR/NasT family two-component response regulator
MESELVLAKQALLDRRFIEQAKTILMLKRGLTEQQSHQFLQPMYSLLYKVELQKNVRLYN